MTTRRHRLLACLLGTLLLVSACGADDDSSDAAAGSDAATADDREDDDGDGRELGDAWSTTGAANGDAAASTVTFQGEELEVTEVMCVYVEVDEHLRVIARDDTVEPTMTLTINETTGLEGEPGARARMVRGQGPEFDGHAWDAPSEAVGDAEIDPDGARGSQQLSWDPNSGEDEDGEGEDAHVEFDLVC